ncbi:MAG: hypothetical protein LBN24_00585, partial [Mediterranea sp.]|nr:hypothetical protein [Mediterranea sp.]
LLSAIPTASAQALRNPDRNVLFFNDLPDEFTTAQAIEVGYMHGLGRRRVQRLLKSLIGLKIRRLEHGAYRKEKEMGL